MATALLYNFAPAKAEAMLALCAAQEIRGRVVEPWEQGQTLGALLDLPLPAARLGARAGTVPGEMLVLAGFAPRALDALLGALPASGVGPVPLKAVVTAHNLTWTGPALYLELLKERRALESAP